MPNKLTKIIHALWDIRTKKSFQVIIIGFFLITGFLLLLFWNKNRVNQIQKIIDMDYNAIISVPANKIDPNNQNKLIHIAGQAETNELLRDEQFGISKVAIKLVRNVEMYQWQETSTQKTEDLANGKSDTVANFTYDKIWSAEIIAESDFEYPAGHVNPDSMLFEKKELFANDVKIGAFTLNKPLIQKIPGERGLAMEEANIKALPQNLQAKARINNGYLYIGDPANPAIGDVRIKFSVIRPVTISIIAKQDNDGFSPYQDEFGKNTELLELGIIPMEKMLQLAQ